MRALNVSHRIDSNMEAGKLAPNISSVANIRILAAGPDATNRRLTLHCLLTDDAAALSKLGVPTNTLCVLTKDDDVWAFVVEGDDTKVDISMLLIGEPQYTARLSYDQSNDSGPLVTTNEKTATVILSQDLSTLETCQSRALALWWTVLAQKYGNVHIQANLVVLHSADAEKSDCGTWCGIDWYCRGICGCCNYPTFHCRVPYEC
ncbi:hypothetical protein [Sorangium sp. So ce117]|uniref:hypothetical protein n=1 Tax=Sorangium sp. So ce117 TaxID=3133277 RepID=UPI003F5FB059